MKSRISGTTMPVLDIFLESGEKIVSEPGQFSWMSSNIKLHTTTKAASAQGIFQVLGRTLTGGGLFMNEYEPIDGQGMVAFSARVPGAIIEIQVTPEQTYMVHRHGFLCGTQGIELSIGFQRSLGAGIFGGEGLILQKLSGSAKAWVELGGEIVTFDLEPGKSILVHPGHIGMFEDNVNFEIMMIPGLKNIIFGGNGVFIARLTGPGKVWLQTLTMPNLAHAVAPYLGSESTTSPSTIGAGVGGVVAGDVIESVFGRLLGKE